MKVARARMKKRMEAGPARPALASIEMSLPSVRSALLLASLGLWACGGGHASEGAGSAEPSASAPPAPSVASGPEQPSALPHDGPPIVHQPGTVPTTIASAQAKSADDAKETKEPPPPPVEPRFEQKGAQAGRRSARAVTSVSLLDSRRIALVSRGQVEVVDVTDGTSAVLTVGALVESLDLRAERFATADASNRVILWDLGGKTPPRAWKVAPKVSDYDTDVPLVISRDGSRVAYGTRELIVWDAESGKELSRTPREFFISQLTVTQRQIGSVHNYQVIQVADADNPTKVTAEATFQTGGTFGVALSPDMKWAAGAAPDGHGMQVADLRVPAAVRSLVDGTDCRHHIYVAFSSDSRYVYAHYGQDRVKGFETGTWKPYASYAVGGGRTIAAMADDLGRVVVVKDDLAPTVVVVSTQKETPLERPFETPSSYSMSEDGSVIVGTDERRAARVWSARTAKVIYEIVPE